MCQTRLVHYDYVVLKTNEIKVAQYLSVAVFVSLVRFVLKVVYIRYVMVFYDHYIAGQPYYIRCWEQQMSRKAIKLCKIQLPFSNENVT